MISLHILVVLEGLCKIFMLVQIRLFSDQLTHAVFHTSTEPVFHRSRNSQDYKFPPTPLL